MTARPKLIRDIRYFEHSRLPGRGDAMPSYVGELYRVPVAEVVAMGKRIAFKAGELGVTIGRADHLYVLLTPELPLGATRRLEYALEPWHVFVAVGLPVQLEGQPADSSIERIRAATFAALRELAPAQEDVLAEVAHLEEALGAEMRIVQWVKTLATHRLTIFFTVRPFGQQSRLWLEVTDQRRGAATVLPLADLAFPEDAFLLVARVSMRDGIVTVNPRRSERATAYLRDYTTPLHADIRALLAA
jgi:hypothetical protein